MEQLLKITTVPISIELKVNNARLEQKTEIGRASCRERV